MCSQGEAPLACEYRVNRPAVAIIMLRGSWVVDLNSEFADDIREIIQISIDNGVIEPAIVKEQALKSAAESAAMILRIDDVISSSKPKGGLPGGPGGMPGGEE